MPSNVKKRLMSIAVALFVFLTGVIISTVKPLEDIPIQILAYILAYFIVSAKDIMRAVKNIKQAKLFDENFLITSVSILSLYMGEYVCAVAIMVIYSLSKLLSELVKNETAGNRFEKIYTLITVIITLAVAIVPTILGGAFAEWFHKAIVLFTLICPLAFAVINAVKLIKK